jgi:hypothetical protein
MIGLDAAARLPDRPFSDPDRTADDLAIMARMLTWLRRHVATTTATTGADATRRDDRVIDPDGGQHRIVLPDPPRLLARHDLVVVGFFGQARADVDHTAIVDLEAALVASMAGPDSPLVYDNVYWPGSGWGNLVLFGDEAAKEAWGRADQRHADAIRRSPAHYHSIRLHNGVLPGGLMGDAPIRLVRTKYFDFATAPTWRAIRAAPPGVD